VEESELPAPAPEPSEEPVEEPSQEPVEEPVRDVVQEQPRPDTMVERKMLQDIAPKSKDDEEILKFIEESRPNIYIVGAGGSGSNTLDRLFEMGVEGVKLVGMNTDARHLLHVRANRKVLMGKKTSKGRGAGSNPVIGEEAAKESGEDIKEAVKDPSLVFITCGLGGGTGTGSAPIIAEAAKNMGALTVAIVTLPFSSEGRVRMENAIAGLDKLKKHSDTIIVIKNDKLLNLVPDLPLNTAFKVCDEVLAGSVKGIAELVTKSGLVNVDFADLRTILTDGGFAVIGLGEASLDAKKEDRVRVAVETSLNSPLLDADISDSKRALINVIGGDDMSLKEAEFVVAETASRINPDAHIIWGARVDPNIKKTSMRVLVVVAGVKFPRRELLARDDASVETLDLDIIG
jgi:cell division protein FtsZ